MHAAPPDEQAIFNVAVQIPSAEARSEYLSQVCGEDVAIFDRLSALLRAHDERPEFLESPPSGLDATVVPSDSNDDTGKKIGPYKLLQQIGEGGFGVVYMAEQTEPVRRKVALKVIKPGMDTKDVIARFEAERQAVALMDHPNIAHILDAGTTDAGRPYFVMELVKGVSITEYCDANNLPTRDRLELFATVCRAVQHAHQKGVIHRDMKPSNILVTLHDGTPVPKIIDFGVSKALSFQLTDKTMFTRYGQMIGTPQYMSPEQAEMSGLDVDTRTDIYSLGVLLYELLTGRPPFDAEQLNKAGIDEMRRMIVEKEPARPSHMIRTLDAETATLVATHRSSKPVALSRSVQGELDWIVMKALEKDRNRRYETANSLAEDVERHLRDDVVIARPPSKAYRLWKTVKRHRVASIAIAAVSLSLTLGLAVSLMAMAQAREEADNANQTLGLVLSILSKAKVNPQTGQQYTVQEALDDLGARLEGETQLTPQSAARLHLAIAKAYYFGGMHERATRHFEKALRLGEESLGAESPTVAQALRYLGTREHDPDKLLRAVAIERKAKSKRELVKTLTLLGVVLHRVDKLEEAEEHLSEACRLFDPSDPTIQFEEIPFLPMSHLLRQRAQVEQANEYQDKAVAAAKALFGTDASSWWKQRVVYRSARRYRAFEHVCLVAQDLKRSKASGDDLRDLSKDFRFLGRCNQADQLIKASIKRNFAAKNFHRYGWHIAHRAQIYCDLHDFETAERLLRKALDISKRNKSTNNLTYAMFRSKLASVLNEHGKSDKKKLEEAKTLNKEVAEKIKHLQGKHLTILDTERDKGAMYLAMLLSDQEVPIREIIEAFDIKGLKPGELSFYQALIMGLAYQKQGQAEQTISALETASLKREHIGRDAVYSGWIEERLFDLYVERDEIPRALKFFEKLVAYRDIQLPGRQADLAFSRILLARVLIQEKNQPDRTRTLLLEAERILESNEMTPEGPKQEIARLLEKIDKAGDPKE